MKIIAVTGGSGFVGRPLIKRLLVKGYKIKALQNKSPVNINHDNLEIITGGLTNSAALDLLTQNADAIIHCGGLVAARKEEDFHSINAKGTALLASFATQNDVKRFLLISSLAARHAELSPYAASKKAAEETLIDLPTLDWDILRPPAVYGPGDPHVLTIFKALKQGIGLMPGGKDARFSIIYVNDLILAICAWIESETAHKTTYEIDDGTESGYSWQDIIEPAADILNVRPKYITPPRALLMAASHIIKFISSLTGKTPFLTPGKVREMTYPEWICDSAAFTQATEWQPETTFENGVKTTLDWYRAQGWL